MTSTSNYFPVGKIFTIENGFPWSFGFLSPADEFKTKQIKVITKSDFIIKWFNVDYWITIFTTFKLPSFSNT
jgi:hypothetical protein